MNGDHVLDEAHYCKSAVQPQLSLDQMISSITDGKDC